MDPIPLTKIMALIAADHKEVARLEKMIIDLKEEDATLLKTLEIDDAAQFKTLSNIRLKTELAESKIPQLQERLQRYYAQLVEQDRTTAMEFNAEVTARVEAAVQKMAETLLPYCSDQNEACDQARRVARESDGPIQGIMRLEITGLYSIYPEDSVKVANQILANWAEFSKSA